MFPDKELRGHIHDSYIHVSVCDLYIPTIGLHILLQENTVGGPMVGIYKSLTDTVHECFFLQFDFFTVHECGNNDAEQFNFWEYLNRNQTFIFDSHWPFICSVFKAYPMVPDSTRPIQSNMARTVPSRSHDLSYILTFRCVSYKMVRDGSTTV